MIGCQRALRRSPRIAAIQGKQKEKKEEHNVDMGIDNVEEGREGDYNNEHHHAELFCVIYCLHDELYVVGICWEQPHPVKDLDPHEKDEETSDSPEELHRDDFSLVVATDTEHELEQGGQENNEEINYIPRVC